MRLTITEIGGKRYATVAAAAKFMGRTSTTIRRLIEYGNSVRKLRAEKIDGHYMIPEEEIYNFPIVKQGHRTNCIYKVDKEGELVLCTPAESAGEI